MTTHGNPVLTTLSTVTAQTIRETINYDSSTILIDGSYTLYTELETVTNNDSLHLQVSTVASSNEIILASGYPTGLTKRITSTNSQASSSS